MSAATTVEPPPPLAGGKRVNCRPTFLGALRGIWWLTFKAQLVWQRLPILLLTLLAVPVLVYITVAPPGERARGSLWVGDISNPRRQVQRFRGELAVRKKQLQPEQRRQLDQIFSEEYARADEAWRDDPSPPTTAEQTKQIEAAFQRIRERVQPVLDDGQFPQFRSFQAASLSANRVRLTAPRWSRTAPFYHWLIDLYFFVLLPLNCVRVCGALIRDDVQADTLGFLMTRPLSRAKLIIIKYFCQTAWLQIILLVEGLLLFAAGQLRGIPALGALLPLFLVAQLLAVLAWSALGTFLGIVSKRYMAMAMVYGAIIEMGIGRIPTNINTLSMMRHLKILLSHNAALQGTYEWPDAGMLFSAVALVVATGIFLGLAAALFTFREYHRTVEMQQ